MSQGKRGLRVLVSTPFRLLRLVATLVAIVGDDACLRLDRLNAWLIGDASVQDATQPPTVAQDVKNQPAPKDETLGPTVTPRGDMSALAPHHLEEFRQLLEQTAKGKWIMANHRNRHLYAVLRPNKQECLQRIKNVLACMSPAQCYYVHKCVKERLGA